LVLASVNYASCRADGTDKVECVVISVVLSALEVLAFAFMTVINLITALFPNGPRPMRDLRGDRPQGSGGRRSGASPRIITFKASLAVFC